MENQITELLKYYLTGKITDVVLQSEIERIYEFPSNVHFIIENVNSSTDSSFCVAVVPEYNGFALFANIVIDAYILKSKIDADKLETLIKTCLNYVQTAIKHYYSFIVTHNDVEVGRSECLELDLSIQKDFINQLPTSLSMIISGEGGLFDMSKLDDVLLSITAQNETFDRILEFVKLYHLLPSFAISKTEELFKRLNKLDENEVQLDGVFAPTYNKYYDDMVGYNPKSLAVSYSPTDNPRDLIDR